MIQYRAQERRNIPRHNEILCFCEYPIAILLFYVCCLRFSWTFISFTLLEQHNNEEIFSQGFAGIVGFGRCSSSITEYDSFKPLMQFEGCRIRVSHSSTFKKHSPFFSQSYSEDILS